MSDVLQQLAVTLAERKHSASADTSYVASLHDKGLNKILEKVGEEATEVILAAKDLQAGGSDTDTIDLSGVSTGVTATFSASENGSFTDGSDTTTFDDIEAVLTAVIKAENYLAKGDRSRARGARRAECDDCSLSTPRDAESSDTDVLPNHVPSLTASMPSCLRISCIVFSPALRANLPRIVPMSPEAVHTCLR